MLGPLWDRWIDGIWAFAARQPSVLELIILVFSSSFPGRNFQCFSYSFFFLFFRRSVCNNFVSDFFDLKSLGCWRYLNGYTISTVLLLFIVRRSHFDPSNILLSSKDKHFYPKISRLFFFLWFVVGFYAVTLILLTLSPRLTCKNKYNLYTFQLLPKSPIHIEKNKHWKEKET